ncbi:MAG TPA: DUF3822 family protein [Chitinophagaceae bacterium]|nr:DUF3822 family protein [Chitinophagaceae bacterium]
MIKPVFHIETTEINADNSVSSKLLMELSEHAFSYLITAENHDVLAAAYFVLPDRDDLTQAHALREIIYGQDILQLSFRQTLVLYNLSEGALIPDEYHQPAMNNDVADVLFGNLKKQHVVSEKHEEAVVHTIYRIPQNIHNLIHQKFPTGSFWHLYSLWLKAMKDSASADKDVIELIFASDKMLVSIFKVGQLQLLQSIPYSTPEDVAYQLLNYCQELSISPEECLIFVSGYIDEDSALFNELKKYFLRLEFDKLIGSDQERLGEYPVHYFSYLQKIAACVS